MPKNSNFDSTNNKDSSLDFSRRAVLAATTGLTVGVAGCSSNDQNSTEANTTETNGSGGESSDSSSTSVFDEVRFEDRELKATVSDDTITQINVIQDGEQIGSGEFSTGASTATVWTADYTLHGEEFELIAVDEGGNQIGKTTVSFAAEVEISRIRTQAMKNDREATGEVAKEYTEEFSTALLTIENTGDGPLFLGAWNFNYDGTAVFLTDGVPQAVGDEQISDVDAPNDRVNVPAGGSVEVRPFVTTNQHLTFRSGEQEEWPESVRSMGEFPKGYADGDDVDVTATIVDDTGEEVEATVTATYSGGLLQTGDFNGDNYVPANFTA